MTNLFFNLSLGFLSVFSHSLFCSVDVLHTSCFQLFSHNLYSISNQHTCCHSVIVSPVRAAHPLVSLNPFVRFPVITLRGSCCCWLLWFFSFVEQKSSCNPESFLLAFESCCRSPPYKRDISWWVWWWNAPYHCEDPRSIALKKQQWFYIIDGLFSNVFLGFYLAWKHAGTAVFSVFAVGKE